MTTNTTGQFVKTDFASEFAAREQLPECVEFDVELRGDNWTFQVQRVAREKLKHAGYIVDRQLREVGTTLQSEQMALYAEQKAIQAKMAAGEDMSESHRAAAFLGRQAALNNATDAAITDVLWSHVKSWEHHTDDDAKRLDYNAENKTKLLDALGEMEKVTIGQGYSAAISELEKKKGLLVLQKLKTPKTNRKQRRQQKN